MLREVVPLLVLPLLLLPACAEVDVAVKSKNALGPLRCDPSHLSLEFLPQPQEDSAWCWAASAQSIMRYHGFNEVRQCELVSRARPYLARLGVTGGCCREGGPTDGGNTQVLEQQTFQHFVNECLQGGWPYEIFERFGIAYEITTPYTAPTWDFLQNQLCDSGPFIFTVEWVEGGRHTGVVKGYHTTDVPGYERWVDLDGHDDGGFFAVPYEEFVMNPKRHVHYVDFINIHPRR